MKTKTINTLKTVPVILGLGIGFASAPVVAGGEPSVDKRAKRVPYDPSGFKKDPSTEKGVYNVEEQLKIYGGKKANKNPRPLLELGRKIYAVGAYRKESYALGKKNPVHHEFSIYGDWRTAIAHNDNGGAQVGQIATTMNLDIDYRFTATERIHAVVTPFENKGRFTRRILSGPRAHKSFNEFSMKFDALYLEGDLGAIISGMSDKYTGWDMPFAVGLMPLQFHNGIWVDDAFSGLAFTIQAKNSPRFDISNMDITFFAGFDKVTTALRDGGGNAIDSNKVQIYGVNAFIDANNGYWELGYAFTNGRKQFDDQDYHSVSISFTKRYGGWLSNSVRLISSFGQERNGDVRQTADGNLLLIENSLITSKPSTLIPYLNIFAGFDRPQPLARANAVGGILKNVGILFESDGLTAYPTLDASANNTWGFALGVNYLFALNQQVVVELATVQARGPASHRIARGDQWGLGIRYQRPLNRSWIFRADAMVADRENDSNLSGVRIELRKKF